MRSDEYGLAEVSTTNLANIDLHILQGKCKLPMYK